MAANGNRGPKPVMVKVDPVLWDRFKLAAKVSGMTLQGAMHKLLTVYLRSLKD